MRGFFIQLLCSAIILTGCVHSLTGEEAVKRFFDYFKADELVGIPVVKFDEPAPLLSPLHLVPISLINGTILGHSRITIVEAVVNMVTMKGSIKVKAPRIEIDGNYTFPGIFTTSKGFINATLLNIDAVVNLTMTIDENFTPLLKDVELDLDYEDMALNLTNLTWEHDLIVSSGSIRVFSYDLIMELFRQVKPLIIEMTNKEIRKFVSTLPPVVDYTTSDQTTRDINFFLQRLFQYVGMEPMRIPGRSSRMLGAKFKVSDIVLSGISVVNRIDTMLAIYSDKQLYVEFKMSYPKLMMSYTLDVDYGLFLNFDTTEKNQLNNVVVTGKLTIDPKQATPPQIKYFNLDVGSFGKVRDGKKGGLLHLVGDVFHTLSDSVRSEIVSALSSKLKKILQDELNKTNLEKTLSDFVKSKKNQ